MSPLRRRMIDDMQIRNLTPNTQRVYVSRIMVSDGAASRVFDGLPGSTSRLL